MSGHDVTARMRVLAEQFASERPGLDLSLGSLTAFEEVIASARASRRESLLMWGAYLGETVIRACGSELRWLDFADAARALPSVASVGEPEETAVVLASGSACWFPLVKINKFLDHGTKDSPAAFANALVATMQPPKTQVVQEEIPPEVTEAVRGFFAGPSPATMCTLASAPIWSSLHWSKLAQVLREQDAQSAALYPFFAVPAEGRGRYRTGVAATAAHLVWFMLKHGLSSRDEIATLSTMLDDPDKQVRERAAFVLARWAFQVADPSTGLAQYEHDAAVRRGTLSGLQFVVGDAVWDKSVLRDPVSFAPLLNTALRTPAERTIALKIVQQFASRLHADITPMLGPLLEVLAGGKPAQVELALQTLQSHAHGIQHGRAPFDPRVTAAIPLIIGHTRTLPGKVKVTKTQIASHYALSAYQTLHEHLTEAQQTEIGQAFVATSHMR